MHLQICPQLHVVQRHQCLLVPQILIGSLLELDHSIHSLTTMQCCSAGVLDNLHLTAAYSTLVQAYVAFQSPGVTEATDIVMGSYRELISAATRYLVLCFTSSSPWYTGYDWYPCCVMGQSTHYILLACRAQPVNADSVKGCGLHVCMPCDTTGLR